MSNVLATLISLYSVLIPQKVWFAPNQPLTITIKSDAPIHLVLTDFAGQAIEPRLPADVPAGQSVDIKQIFPSLAEPGTYLLYATPQGQTGSVTPPTKFLGTPLVIEVRSDQRRGAYEGAEVTKIVPLQYAHMTTDAGQIDMIFYYDVAPNTVDNFLSLSAGGYYDGLVFHRILKNFVIQGGDPLGSDPDHAGSGGPGYHVEAEFNSKPHLPGVLSMARSGDPNEQYGMAPRPEFANSAGSQFFICLDYTHTKSLDNKYTAFGQVADGMDVVNRLADTPVKDPQTGQPVKPPAIQKVEVLPVTQDHNPYTSLIGVPATQPATSP